MIRLNFKVVNQRLTSINTEYLANKTHNILECVFDINGDDWNDKSIFAILWTSKHKAYQLHLEDNAIIVPSDIVKGRRFKIGLYAYQDDTRITTNQLTINLAESGYTQDIEDLEDVDIDIWSQIFDGLDCKANRSELHEVAFTGDYDTLENKPILFDGEYSSLNNIPETFPPTTHKHNISDINDFPNLSDVAITGDYNDLNNIPDSYDADNITIIRNNGLFGVKDNSIGRNQLNTTINTSLNYADSWNSSIAKNITDSDITNWNNKQDSNLVTSLNNASDTTYPSTKCVKDYIDNIVGGLSEYINR